MKESSLDCLCVRCSSGCCASVIWLSRSGLHLVSKRYKNIGDLKEPIASLHRAVTMMFDTNSSDNKATVKTEDPVPPEMLC